MTDVVYRLLDNRYYVRVVVVKDKWFNSTMYKTLLHFKGCVVELDSLIDESGDNTSDNIFYRMYLYTV